MVRIALLACLVFSTPLLGLAQSVDFLVGGRYNINQLQGNYNYSVVVPDIDGWPLRSRFTNFSMAPSQEAQIGLRFNFKNSWFFEVNYGNSVTKINLMGESNYTDSMLNELARNQVYELWLNSSSSLTWDDYYNEYFDVAKEEQRSNWRTPYTYQEEIKSHNTSFLLGYKFLKNRPVRPFVESGLSWMYQYESYLYQYINQTSEYVPNNVLYYDRTPRIWYSLLFGSFGFGIQSHRLKTGLRMQTNFTALESPVKDGENFLFIPLYDRWNQYSFYLHYDLFSADIVKSENKKKLKELEHVVSGKYEKQEKKFVFGARLNYPINSAVNISHVRSDSLTIFKTEAFESLGFDTVTQGASYNDMMFSRVRRVSQTPELNLYGQFKLWKFLYYETNLGYQRTNYEIQTLEYNIDDYLGEFGEEAQDVGGLRMNFDVVTWRNILKISPYQNEIMKSFINVGFGVDTWMPLRFSQGVPGVNRNSSHEHFYNMYLLGDENFDAQAYYASSDRINETVDLSASSWDGSNTFITYHLGAELEFDRYKVGLNYESSGTLLDPYILNTYNRFALSLSYNIRR